MRSNRWFKVCYCLMGEGGGGHQARDQTDIWKSQHIYIYIKLAPNTAGLNEDREVSDCAGGLFAFFFFVVYTFWVKFAD